MIENDKLEVRLFSSMVMILLFLVIVLVNNFFFVIFFNILLFLSNWESLRLFKYKSILENRGSNLSLSRCKVSSYDFTTIILISLFINYFQTLNLFCNFLILSCLLLIILNFKKKNFYKLLSLIYVSLAFYFLLDLRNSFNFSNYLFFVVFFAMVVDISAYFVGKLIGGIKLATNISPKKTVSGSIGGIIIPLIICIIIFGKNSSDYSNIIFMSVILSIIAQIGDLIESSFKRYCHVKDSSNIIPGHGGILDRIDSILSLIIFVSIMKLFDYNFFFIV